jgi:hypothetical protein
MLLFPLAGVFPCVLLALPADQISNEKPQIVHLTARQPSISRIIRRQIGGGHNLPLGDAFNGTDLQVSCLPEILPVIHVTNAGQWYGTVQVGSPPQNM